MTKLLTTVHAALSVDRLDPYRREVGGDLASAIKLYEWNADVSAAFRKDIGHLEVLLRNTVHRRLTKWSAAMHGDLGGISTLVACSVNNRPPTSPRLAAVYGRCINLNSPAVWLPNCLSDSGGS
jgi:hypothetical protein